MEGQKAIENRILDIQSCNTLLVINRFMNFVFVGNLSIMTALGVECTHTTRPHLYAYALVKERARYAKNFTLLPLSLPFPSSQHNQS